MEPEDNAFFDKRAWLVIAGTIVLVVVGELLLVWQYNNLTEDRIPELEERIAEQQRELESTKAERTVRTFLDARLRGNAEKATRYFTEEAMQQLQEGDFSLAEENLQDYEILEVTEAEEGVFEFIVRIVRSDASPETVEQIEVMRIEDIHYIHRVTLAG